MTQAPLAPLRMAECKKPRHAHAAQARELLGRQQLGEDLQRPRLPELLELLDLLQLRRRSSVLEPLDSGAHAESPGELEQVGAAAMAQHAADSESERGTSQTAATDSQTAAATGTHTTGTAGTGEMGGHPLVASRVAVPLRRRCRCAETTAVGASW